MSKPLVFSMLTFMICILASCLVAYVLPYGSLQYLRLTTYISAATAATAILCFLMPSNENWIRIIPIVFAFAAISSHWSSTFLNTNHAEFQADKIDRLIQKAGRDLEEISKVDSGYRRWRRLEARIWRLNAELSEASTQLEKSGVSIIEINSRLTFSTSDSFLMLGFPGSQIERNQLQIRFDDALAALRDTAKDSEIMRVEQFADLLTVKFGERTN